VSRRPSAPVPVSGIDLTALGTRVQRFREARALSQAQLATLAGVDSMVISRLERGQKRRLTVDAVFRLAQVLKLTLDQLCGLVPEPPLPVVRQTLPVQRPATLPADPWVSWDNRYALVAHVLGWRREGHPWAQLAARLNAWGIPMPRSRGGWTASNLWAALGPSAPHTKTGQRDVIRTYGPHGTHWRQADTR